MGLKSNLVLVRHGQSEWNEKNLFTGWKDPGLTELGYEEAKKAGELIKATEIIFTSMFTSALKRAQLTGEIILKGIGQEEIPVIRTKHLTKEIMEVYQASIRTMQEKNGAMSKFIYGEDPMIRLHQMERVLRILLKECCPTSMD